ncbi:hypothetical protein Syun_009019 [Stephania yunnanensis]|uniref:Uncharacterized protein n=1 Tax=Stephania yunnanensis TaxID=152371 RepID=A0AAP0KET7_9MAGN
MRRSIGHHETHRRGTLFPVRQSINGGHRDAQQVPRFLPTQLIDDVVILDALPDSNSFGWRNSRVRFRPYPIQQGGRIFSDEHMMAVQHRSFFEEQSRERKSGWSEEAILKSLKTRNYKFSQEAESLQRSHGVPIGALGGTSEWILLEGFEVHLLVQSESWVYEAKRMLVYASLSISISSSHATRGVAHVLYGTGARLDVPVRAQARRHASRGSVESHRLEGWPTPWSVHGSCLGIAPKACSRVPASPPMPPQGESTPLLIVDVKPFARLQ